MLGYKPNKTSTGSTWRVLNNAGEINQRRRKWREIVFMDWQTQQSK